LQSHLPAGLKGKFRTAFAERRKQRRFPRFLPSERVRPAIGRTLRVLVVEAQAATNRSTLSAVVRRRDRRDSGRSGRTGVWHAVRTGVPAMMPVHFAPASRRTLAPAGPRPLEGAEGRGRTTLPEDLQRDQAVRVQVLHMVGVALWSMAFVMDLYLAPHGNRGPYQLFIDAFGIAYAAGVALYARFGPASHRAKVNAGAALIVPHALALALLNSWVPQPVTSRPLSGITVLLLLFGMLAPARPAIVLAVSLVAASMDPLCVWIAHLRGLPVPSPLATLLMFYPNYACAFLTVVPARILFRLGRQIRAARSLGSYQLLERLGGGGMGEVWLARHRLLARTAAIKLIRPEMLGGGGAAAEAAIGRFEREAQATAALTSPHTVRLFDFGLSADGTFYYAMECLEGRDLDSLVRQFGPLPAGRAVHLVRQICRSLAEAHAMGLIHRDVKPANVYVCRMGLEHDFVKVLDFGLVKPENPADGPTMLTMGPPIGTPAYMAPEAILSDPSADRRVDVYAVGCVFYYLLTGETVFVAPNPMQLLMQHVHDAAVPPSRRAPQAVPLEIDALVLSCLAKDPDERPSSAGELLRRLDALRIGDWDAGDAGAWWREHLPRLAAPALDDALRTTA
jgi:serine/threonine-protein kinase